MNSETSPLTDSPTVTWLDAFPWLPAVAHASSVQWATHIDDDSGEPNPQVVAHIAELASERLSHWSIGQILPGLRPDVELSFLNFPTRAANALYRHGMHTTGDLAGEVLASLMNWRGIGARTINSILETLIGVSMSAATPPVSSVESRGTADAELRLEPVPSSNGYMEQVMYDLETLANWYMAIGLPNRLLLAGMHQDTMPESAAAAIRRLRAVRASDAARGEDAQPVAAMLESALQALDSRAADILQRRLFSYDPPTLDQLARDLGVTRERVRQIEGKARGALLTAVTECAALHAVSTSVVEAIGTVRPLAEILEVFPALAGEVPRAQQPAWRVLDQLDDSYQIVDGWCAVPTISAAEMTTQAEVLESVDQYGVARVEDLDVVTVNGSESRDETTKAWLSRCGYTLDGDFVLARTRSVGDYGAAVLSIAGSPMTAQDIVDRFVVDRSPGSLRNAMSQDDRFDRVDRDLWALKEWGMDTYSGIRSIIREQVARAGGQACLEDVIEYITERYSVNASSVVAYASAPPFEVQDGIIRQGRNERAARKTPEGTRRLFRRSDGWAYRVTITADHLRGSGSAAPVAVATILNLQAGDSIQLPSPLGPQTIAWTGIQPSFGTIRRFLTDADVEANTDAFLTISDDRTFGFEVARPLVDDPVSDALSLIGGSSTVENPRAALAEAVSLAVDAPYVSLIAAYRERGDGDIADLLIACRESLDIDATPTPPAENAVDVAEILDLL